MVVRKRGRRAKLLGSRTRGNGDTKNRRGAGSRGGRGLAGSHKHKFSKYYGKFGKEYKKVKPTKEVKALNIEQLVQAMPRLLAEKKAEKSGSFTVVDGQKIGFDKLLGKGNLNEKLSLKNLAVSKKAAEKVKKAGGKIAEAEEEELEAGKTEEVKEEAKKTGEKKEKPQEKKEKKE